MRKKIVSGLLAVALVFTSVPTNVIALGAWGNTDRHNISMTNPFADFLSGNNDKSDEVEDSSDNTTSSLFDDFLNGSSSNSGNSNSSSGSSSSTGNVFDDFLNGNSTSNNSGSAGNSNANTTTNPFDDFISGNTNNDTLVDDEVTNDEDVNDGSNPFDDFSAGNTNDDVTAEQDETTEDEVVEEDELTTDEELSFADLIANFGIADSGVATLDETIEDAPASPISSDNWIAIEIDSTYINTTDNGELKFNSEINTLNADVQAHVPTQTNVVSDNSSDEVSKFSSFFSFFNPMSIKFNNNIIVANIINSRTAELFSNQAGYYDSLSAISNVSAEDVTFFYKYGDVVPGYLQYLSNKTSIISFEPGVLPVFDPAKDFENASSSTVFTGWKFDNYATVSLESASSGATTIDNVTELPLSAISSGDTISIPSGTTITAMFSSGTINVEGWVKHTDKDFTDYSSLTATLYDDNDNVIEKVNVGQYGSVEFTGGSSGIYPGYYYYIVVTGGSDIEDSQKYGFVALEADMSLQNTIYVEYITQEYSVSYLTVENGELSLSEESYEVGETVTLTFDDDFHSYLENEMLSQWTGWLFYDGQGTSVNIDTIVSIESVLSFKMPAYSLKIIPDTEEFSDGYTVYYYSDGDTEKTQTSLKIGDTIPYYSPNSRHGYTFTGWYTNAACTTEWDFDTKIAASHFSNNNTKTLYAGWEGNTVNVVINYDGSTDNSGQLTSMKVGQSRTISAGTKVGSSFGKWSWYNDSIFEYSYSMSSYTTPSIYTSSISFVVPPLDTGDTLTINANWEPLYAYVYVDNIINGYDEGDSAYVYIYSSTHGNLTGEFVGFNSSGDEYYYFDLADYGSGMYTVEVVSRTSNQELTTVMYVEDGEFNHAYVTLLPEDKIATVTNTASNVLNVGTDNLQDMFTSSELTSNDIVTINMQVQSVTSTNADAQLILSSITDNQAIGLFLDVSLLKTIGTTKYQMFDTPNSKGLNVIVQLPDGFKEQKSYFVSTVHDGTFSTLSSSQVTYDADSNSISFYATEFSVFGIGYSGTSGSSSLVGTSIPTDAGYDIPLFQNVVVGQYIEGLGKYVLVHPDSANWAFAGWYHGGTLEPLTAAELVSFVVTDTILTNGIYPRFVQVDEYGNPLTSPVPQTGVTTLANLF